LRKFFQRFVAAYLRMRRSGWQRNFPSIDRIMSPFIQEMEHQSGKNAHNLAPPIWREVAEIFRAEQAAAARPRRRRLKTTGAAP
jgi:hypothetical protein